MWFFVHVANFLLQIFEELSKRNPEFESKIKAVEGDMMEHNLGISHEDAERMRNNVSIVFHSAATVRFDEPLRYVIINLLDYWYIPRADITLSYQQSEQHQHITLCNIGWSLAAASMTFQLVLDPQSLLPYNYIIFIHIPLSLTGFSMFEKTSSKIKILFSQC